MVLVPCSLISAHFFVKSNHMMWNELWKPPQQPHVNQSLSQKRIQVAVSCAGSSTWRCQSFSARRSMPKISSGRRGKPWNPPQKPRFIRFIPQKIIDLQAWEMTPEVIMHWWPSLRIFTGRSWGFPNGSAVWNLISPMKIAMNGWWIPVSDS